MPKPTVDGASDGTLFELWIDLPHAATARRRFLRELRRCYAEK